MDDRQTDNIPKYGDFPFALTKGAEESRFLTWLRNHANYMAVGGLLDYLRIAAVLLRGIFINALVLLPPLMIAGIVLGFVYEGMGLPSAQQLVEGQQGCGLSRPILIPLALIAGTLWILLFPVVSTLMKIAGYQKSLASGSDSSVKSRDRYERSFAIALLLFVGIVLLEVLPHVVCYYHQFRIRLATGFPWKEYIGAATVAIGSLSAAPKLLNSLSGAWKKLAVAVIGIGGLLAPLLVVVAVSDFVVFERHPGDLLASAFDGLANLEYMAILVIGSPIVFSAGILIAIGTGRLAGAFSHREYRRLLQGMLAILIIHIAVFFVIWGCFVAASHVGINSDRVAANFLVLVAAIEVWLFGWLTVDINQTSVHALYRDRLASAFLLGVNGQGDVDIEQDVPLSELACHETGSIAPYHLINVALNLQGSDDIGLRDRHSDFFILSKKYIGGARTGYCRTATMEQVFPQLDLASAMAISAAAASPNMGRGTSPALVAFMTMINVRLGVWVPNPGRLEENITRMREMNSDAQARRGTPGFAFSEIFEDELQSIRQRWEQLGAIAGERRLAGSSQPTTAHGLAGIAFSGGGIRSAAFNLGIVQTLHRAGLFHHFDYMSTVSGGGYLGSSISTLMRFKSLPVSEIDGKVTVEAAADGSKLVTVSGTDGQVRLHRYSRDAELLVKDGDPVKPGTRLIRRPGPQQRSEQSGRVAVQIGERGRQQVTILGSSGEQRSYTYSRYDELMVEDGQTVAADQVLVAPKNTFAHRFVWRVRPAALLLEMTMRLDERHLWVNLSDGGHIENLATIELLRRRCKLIVIGDGECDPEMHFAGLATLLRTARIDLGIHIDIDLGDLRLNAAQYSVAHLVVGRIHYPGEAEPGFLLYLKSSCTGDEDEVIGQYRNMSRTFPHETTADQFFNEGQFEAYRALGEHVGDGALSLLAPSRPGGEPFTYAQFLAGMEALSSRARPQTRSESELERV